MSTWTPTPAEVDGAADLLRRLLALPEGEQLNTLALLANLWCYHRELIRKGGRSLAANASAR